MSDEENQSPPKRGRGRPRTKPIKVKSGLPRGRPKKIIVEEEPELDFKRPRGRPRRYEEGHVKEINPDEYFKNGRISVFNEETFAANIESHCLLLTAIHRYYIEMEEWCNTRSYASSRRLYYWLMRILKQVQVRRLQIKQFQNSRDPRFNPEVYKASFLHYLETEHETMEKDLENTLKQVRKDLGLPDE